MRRLLKVIVDPTHTNWYSYDGDATWFLSWHFKQISTHSAHHEDSNRRVAHAYSTVEIRIQSKELVPITPSEIHIRYRSMTLDQ